MSQALKVLLVEDDWSVRSAVRDHLVRHGMVVAEADCLEAALMVADAESPSVAVIDIVLPERAGQGADFDQHIGIETARQMRQRWPQIGIVFLSAYADRAPEVIQMSMGSKRGVVYLIKGSKPLELLNAIHRVAQGAVGLEIAPEAMARRKTPFDLAWDRLTAAEQESAKVALAGLSELSESEWRVFEAVGQCRTQDQAAADLALSPKTVSSHVNSIYGKLRIREGSAGLNPLALLAKVHLLYGLHQMETAPRG